MLEEILDRRNIERALESVEANKGSSGIDDMPWTMLRPYINANWQQLRKSILEECYKPKPVREVEIDKSSGGKRKLGIPTVVGRMITQAIAQWLMPKVRRKFFKQKLRLPAKPKCTSSGTSSTELSERRKEMGNRVRLRKFL
jgi:retron-type reverse transcriptase